jgi:excisionase family DNA binding protein
MRSIAAIFAAAVREAFREAFDRLASSLVRDLSPLAVSKEDAARLTGLPVPAIEQLFREGRLAYVQVGTQRGRVIPVESLRQFIEANLQPTGEDLPRKRSRR